MASAPPAEPSNDGRIQEVIDGLMVRSDQRDEKGRFTFGQVKTFEHSETFWTELESVKANIIARVKQQLAVEHDDGRETLINLIDGYVEAHLLRKSAFMRMCAMGGPVTNKGKVRGLLQAWGSFFDREMRAAEKLGLERRSKDVRQTPREWLESLVDEQEDQHDDTPDATAQPGRPGESNAD